ncbi:MAG: GH3 auxin-responsive promoter family protein [Gemmatimonadota bacterium]|nr:GH3 auxin-responsive promoter family protein [Gemmatimonadota bacterium]
MTGGVLSRLARLPATPLGRLRRALRDPVRTQHRLLRKLLRRAEHTDWGRTHGFAPALQSDDVVQAFQEYQGLNSYHAVRAYVDRARAGEANVLWPGRTRHFGISSGTVSSGQLIPVSPAMLRAMTRSSLVPGLQYGSVRSFGYLGGKILSIPGGVSEDPARPGVWVGEVSGLMAAAVPNVMSRRFQAIPRQLMLMEGWDEKLQQIATHTARQDIRAIIMVPSWAPMLFDMVLGSSQSDATTHAARVREVWPGLQVFFSGGVALRSYRPILERYLGSDVDLIESYSASEGFFAFQDDVDACDLLLHVDSGVFYEFVRIEEVDRDRPARHTVADVEPGVDYALFVSTCSGLWAYEVQDVVRFTSTSPLRLRVVGRTGAILDEFGEALHAEEVELALAHAARLTGARCLHHHVTYAPTTGAVTQHEWLLEFAVAPDDLGAFTAALDGYLQEHNRHYLIRREPGVLAPPAVTVLPSGACVTYLRRHRTRMSAQTKLPSVSPDRDVATGLREAAGSLVVESGLQ